MPSLPTFGDFAHGNSFAALSQRERKAARRTTQQLNIGIDENGDVDTEQELQEVTAKEHADRARDSQSRWRGTPDTRHPPAGRRTRARAHDADSASYLRRGTRSCVPPAGDQKITDAQQHTDKGMQELAMALEQMQHEPRATLAGVPQGHPGHHHGALGVLEHGQVIGDELLVAAPDEVKIKVAADTGAVDTVVRPGDLPGSVHVTPNSTGRHFVGASNEHIENYGLCDTVLQSDHGQVACEWKVADVSRALHSISKVAGPAEGPGDHDVLFNNRVGVVVPPGIVDLVFNYVKPLMQYDREGGLYVAEVTMSGFARPGQGQ